MKTLKWTSDRFCDDRWIDRLIDRLIGNGGKSG